MNAAGTHQSAMAADSHTNGRSRTTERRATRRDPQGECRAHEQGHRHARYPSSPPERRSDASKQSCSLVPAALPLQHVERRRARIHDADAHAVDGRAAPSGWIGPPHEQRLRRRIGDDVDTVFGDDRQSRRRARTRRPPGRASPSSRTPTGASNPCAISHRCDWRCVVSPAVAGRCVRKMISQRRRSPLARGGRQPPARFRRASSRSLRRAGRAPRS